MRGEGASRLTGAAAAPVLEEAVAAAGGRLLWWRARQVDHRPGRSTTVVYDVRVEWADRDQDETLVARAEGTDVEVWRFPLDPDLPALIAACDPVRVRDLLVDVGAAPARTAPRDVRLRRRGYRPRRRAVIEARVAGRSTFLKVTRPAQVADLHRRHALLAAAGVPVAEPLHVGGDGLLVLAALPGRPLRAELRAAGPDACPASALLAVLDALPVGLLTLPARRSWSDGAEHYAEVVAAALPAEAGRVRDLAGAVRSGLAACPQDVVPVHGDFYEAHLRVGGGQVRGVLDVDSAGPGHRADDLACLVAHVEVLARVHPADGVRLRGAVDAWLPELDHHHATDAAAVRLRTAGVLLSLATGPYRTQQRGWRRATTARLDLAERRLRTVSRSGPERARAPGR